MNNQFIEDIINGMYDWVRVLDKDDNIIYCNRAMAEGLNSSPEGKKCFEVIGRSGPCDNCISRKAVFDGNPHEKEESINGKIFSVMSSPVKNEKGEIIAVVEVLRDITQLKQMQEKIIEQNKKLKDELDMAKKLQHSLLPKNPAENDMVFSFVYLPCESLGGDFLDIYRIDEDNIGVYIADVSGHGIPASMLTIFIRSSINKKILSPSLVLTELYREFNANNFDADQYITLFYAVINLKNKTVTYSNAGHTVPPIVLGNNRLDFLYLPGVPICNWFETPCYEEGITSLQNEDRLLLYTDGIIEVKNSHKEPFGEKRLIEALKRCKSESRQTLEEIVEEALKYAGIKNVTDIPDDITMALLKLK